MYVVGLMYVRAQGTDRDLVAAYSYVKAASQLGAKVDPKDLETLEANAPPS